MTDALVKTGRLVTVFGGSGFIGRHVVRALARDGWRVRVAARRPDLAFHLQPLGQVGQIHAVQANLRYPESIASALRDSDAAVNLVGLMKPSGKQKFTTIQAAGARSVAEGVRAAGIQKFVHISAIGADPKASSIYARTKAEGEAAIRDILPEGIILRPSVVFGPEDDFFNRFAAMARISPALPLIGGGKTKLQPVFVGDVAKAVAGSLNGNVKTGTIYELGGPEIRSMREIMEFILATIERQRLLLPIPFPLAKLVAFGTEIAEALSLGLFPSTFSLTRDQVELLRRDNIVSEEAKAEGRSLQAFGLEPESFETIVPTYLYRFRKAGQFSDQPRVT
ncbi:complex I NDUFA9 subunit family protein [Beijerinckia mobilis]|uniref:complex I NDUFA9 subunit family protein n=1 Tax=Beijerinckia mobilis TaxID=231434 RepID=UPI000552A008|nr:complex I NDUFA9 subunit family protein [Beijerinckia mobilis]